MEPFYIPVILPWIYNTTLVAENDGITTSVFATQLVDPPPPTFTCPPPPPGFYCGADNSWVANTSVQTNSTFIITTGTVVIASNFTSNYSIVFDGASSNSFNITVQGCLLLAPGTGLVLDLSSGKVKEGSKTIHIAQNSSGCSNSLLSLPIAIKQPEGCEKYTSKIQNSSTRNTLDVLFVLDRSGCKKIKYRLDHRRSGYWSSSYHCSHLSSTTIHLYREKEFQKGIKQADGRLKKKHLKRMKFTLNLIKFHPQLIILKATLSFYLPSSIVILHD